MEQWIAASVAAAVLSVLALELALRMQRRNAQRLQDYLWDETQARIRERVADPDRMASVDLVRNRLGYQQVFLDMICRVTAAALKAPRSVITLVDAESQTFIAHHAVDEREEDLHDGEMPLSSTYCQYTVAADKTLVITNAKRDPLVSQNPCTVELGVRAYLGSPVYSKEGFPVGSLCVFDFSPRKWTRRDIATIESLAALVSL